MSFSQYISGSYKQQFQYASFSPNKVNRPFAWKDPKIHLALEAATGKLGELNAYSLLIPDVDFFIKMHVIKEATTSSRIEGTQTKFEEAVLPKNEIIPERRNDWVEVQNYIKALNFAVTRLKNLPLSMRLLGEVHKVLMKGVRGQHKLPGDIRRTQNWIGGSSLKDAYFIPPHHSELPELLTDLEKFLHNENLEIPLLIKIAIAHYQFETIHPYLDGNGRVGRLLIPLFLIDKGILKKPTLYLSDFFNRFRGEYYDALTLVRTTHDMEQWIRFFLSGIADTAKSGIKSFDRIVKLRTQSEKRIITLGKRAESAQKLLIHLFTKPVVSTSDVEKALKVTPPTANTLIGKMEEKGILREITGFKRNRLFAFSEYLKIFVD